MNKVLLTGRLTRDPSLRYTPGGKAVCEFGLAVNEGYGDKRKAIFLDVESWEKTAEKISKYLTKGRLVNLEGRLIQKAWEDKEGKKHSKVLVNASDFDFLDSTKGEETETIGVQEDNEEVTQF